MPRPPLRRRSRKYRLRSLQTYLTFEGAADSVARSVRDAVLAELAAQELTQKNVRTVLKRIDAVIDRMTPRLLAVVEAGLLTAARSTVVASLDAT